MENNRPKRILVVDDEPNLAKVLAEALSNLGEPCQLLVAEDARQAIQHAQQERIDLVITDYMMPGADGLELINLLRLQSPDTAAILMTAHNSKKLKQQAAENRVDQFMAKPFSLAEIRQVVRTILKRLDAVRTVCPAAAQPSQEMTNLLKELVGNTAVRCAVLITLDGVVLESAGVVHGLNVHVMATLMAANFAAMMEIARLLGAPRSFQAVNHESQDVNVYTCAAGGEHLLVMIYDLTVRTGVVRYYAKRAIDRLPPLLVSQPIRFSVPSADFDRALDEALFDEPSRELPRVEPAAERVLKPSSADQDEIITLDEAIRRGIISNLSPGKDASA